MRKSARKDRDRSYHREAITPIEYSGLQQAYDHFNAELFGGTLGDVFITYQRKAHSFGYFSPDRFSGRVEQSGNHELALNPDAFINQTDKQVCQTLTHEMVHVWQHAFGKPSKRGYHNAEWAAKMKGIGLQPSSTGMVGGKETGQKMMDYIIPDGPFTKAYAKLAATGWKLNLQSAHQPGAKGGANSKTKFTCSSCGQNAWGKPDLAITCEPCGIKMLAAVSVVPKEPRSLHCSTRLHRTNQHRLHRTYQRNKRSRSSASEVGRKAQRTNQRSLHRTTNRSSNAADRRVRKSKPKAD
jgi:SprT-like family